MQERVLKAVDTFYDCVGDRFDLARSARAMSKAANDTGILFTHNFPMRGDSNSLVHHNFPEGAIDSLLERQYDTQAHEMFRHIDSFPEYSHVLRQAYLENEEHYKTRIYQEVLRPWGIHSEGLSILKKNGLNSVSCWSIRHPEQTGLDNLLLSQLGFLSKQLARAIGVQHRLNFLERKISGIGNALDMLDFGLVLYSQTGRMSFANGCAQAIFDQNDGVRHSRLGVEFEERGVDRKFSEILTQSLASNYPVMRSSGGYLRVERPSGKPPLNIVIQPILKNASLELNETSVAVVIFDPLIRAEASLEMLKTNFDLTNAEAGLALEMIKGTSAEQVARTRGVSIHTVRSQLRSLFSKTDTSRQGELIGQLMRSYAGVALNS